MAEAPSPEESPPQPKAQNPSLGLPPVAADLAFSSHVAPAGSSTVGPPRKTPPNEPDSTAHAPQPRRVVLPVALFLCTCLSTFWVGAHYWPLEPIGGGFTDLSQEQCINGALYMAAVVGILFAHEMGHFLQTLRHHIPASLPFFIPVPFTPIGTMGAVIGMEGLKADRRQLFDIGISGPIAGLLLIVPITWYGVATAEFVAPHPRGAIFHDPLLIQLLRDYLRPDIPANMELALNPALMAGWVGCLITGLNMLPISQLDGGHVIYGLFGKRSHLIARLFLVVAMLYVLIYEAMIWITMLVLVILMGADHPKTRDDAVSLGPWRWLVGLVSLIIPILCFPPQGISIGN